MNRRTQCSLVAASFAALSGAASAQNSISGPTSTMGGPAAYQHDDGVSESSSGFDVDGNVAWMNTFQVANGLNTITSIDLAFGSPNRFGGGSTPLFGGEVFKVYVWSGRPNGTYALIAEETAHVDAGSVDTDVLQRVPISATIPGGDGANFFIGASIDIEGMGWPAAFDRDPVQQGGNFNGPAWLSGTFFYGGFNPHNIGGGMPGFPLQISRFIADGQFLLRANAVPAPGGVAVLAGALGLLAIRRR